VDHLSANVRCGP